MQAYALLCDTVAAIECLITISCSFYESANGARLVKILKEERELREARHQEKMKVAAKLAGDNFAALLAGKSTKKTSRPTSGPLSNTSGGGILLPSFGDQDEFNEVGTRRRLAMRPFLLCLSATQLYS